MSTLNKDPQMFFVKRAKTFYENGVLIPRGVAPQGIYERAQQVFRQIGDVKNPTKELESAQKKLETWMSDFYDYHLKQKTQSDN